MSDDSSSWPREGSLAEIDFHTPTSTVASSRIRKSPSGNFEAAPPLREPPRGLPSPGTLPPFAKLEELPRPQRRDSGAFRQSPVKTVESLPSTPEAPQAAAPRPREAELVTLHSQPSRGSLVAPILLATAMLAAAGLVLWLFLFR